MQLVLDQREKEEGMIETEEILEFDADEEIDTWRDMAIEVLIWQKNND